VSGQVGNIKKNIRGKAEGCLFSKWGLIWAIYIHGTNSGPT